MRRAGDRQRLEPRLAAGPLAVTWIAVTLLSRLPGNYGLLGLFSSLALVPVQIYVNRLNARVAPDHEPNARFSAWNWVAVVLGGLLFVLAIIGTMSLSLPNRGSLGD